MGINSESDLAATLTIGPTSEGMVRLFVETEGGGEVSMDFAPEEAVEIAEEIRAAAETAAAGGSPSRRGRRASRRDGGR